MLACGTIWCEWPLVSAERRGAVALACLAHGWTLEEIGRSFGVSRERVRQVVSRRMRLYRHEPAPMPRHLVELRRSRWLEENLCRFPQVDEGSEVVFVGGAAKRIRT